MAECIHHLSICSDCGGLEVVRLDKVNGATGGSLAFDDGRTIDLTGATFYIGPAPTACDAQPEH